jgi:glutaredoxin
VYTHPKLGDDCPSCKSCKGYLKEKGFSFTSQKGREDGWPNKDHRTWPKVYVTEGGNKKFVGGYSDVKSKY